MVFFLSDRILVIFDKEPVFTLFGNYFKDGGTACKIGLGYSVILWNRLSINEDNGDKIYGYKTGKEFTYFPMCYLKYYGYNIEPKNELRFVSNDVIFDYNFKDTLSDKILDRISNNNILNKFIIQFFILHYFMPIIYSIIILLFLIYYFKILRKLLINYSKKGL
jgi:hypothetical protein